MSITKTTLIVVIVLLIFSAWGGFIAGRLYKGDVKFLPLSNKLSDLSDTPGSLFSRRSAYIRGKITRAEGNTLSVVNLSGKTGEVVTTSNVLITDSASKLKPKSASSSSILSEIKLNTDVLITLEFINGIYQAVAINYVPPAPPPPLINPAPQSPKPN